MEELCVILQKLNRGLRMKQKLGEVEG